MIRNIFAIVLLCILLASPVIATDVWLNPAMTSDTAPYCIASAFQEHGGRDAYYAFKHDNTTYDNFWSGTTSMGSWLQLKFQSSAGADNQTYVTRYNVVSQNVDTTRMPRNWTILASNTGAFAGEETTIDTVTEQTGWGATELRNFTIDSPGLYQYYRMNITTTSGYVQYPTVGELELWGSFSSPFPVASFTASATNGAEPLPVQITDTSTGTPTSWDYTIKGYGTNATAFNNASTAQNPHFTFLVGNYTVVLIASNIDGSSTSAPTWVNVSSTLTASFTSNVTSGQSPLAVAFTDTSSNATYKIDSWNWIFGDIGGVNTSTTQNPVHTYTGAGTYSANLTITNTSNSLTSSVLHTILVNATLAADFVGAPTSGFTPQNVIFADLSTGAGIYAWNWSFGDGSFSTLQNPSHNYVTSGSFDVSLNVTGLDGFNKKVVSPYINIASGSAFVGEPNQSSTYALATSFIDSYPTGHLTWNWSFGDSYYNLTQNPRHYYSVAGKYNVALNTTTSAFGINITSQNNYINVSSDVPNVNSWMHMDGSNGGTTFTDLQGNAWLATAATTSTVTQKFGTASGSFHAANSRLTTATSPIFNFGTGNFTIEQWVNVTSSGSGQFIISRTTNAATRVDGWGLYHSTASGTSNGWVFWLGNAATGSTGTFTIPLNQWSHVVIQRIQPQGDVIVSVNGIAVASATGLSGNYDTSNGIAYGNPLSGGAVSSAQVYLDETRISNVGRWTTSSSAAMLFSPPPTAYAGDLYPTFPDPNPGSTLRFKTNPSIPSFAYIANGTNRQRTTQIQYVNLTNNITVQEIFPATHIFIQGVTANSTTYSGINFTYVNIDNVHGIMNINLTRPGGFTTTGLPDSRASIFDATTTYYNYTPPGDIDYTGDIQYFGNGFMGNQTTGLFYPVTNFIATNVSYLDWVTYSNFTISNNHPIVNEETVTFIPKNNWSANQFDWNFGDGTIINNVSAGLQTHIYSMPGNYSVTLRSYLYQNGSVTNTTTLSGAISAIYNASFVQADFTGTPTSGSPGLNVAFTDLSVFGSTEAVSGRTYNWSFGDAGFTLTPYSDTKGSVNHVYTNLGTFTVTLTVNNTLNSSSAVKTNYITISTSQNANTWYTQRLVRFKALTAQGAPILGANISAQFLSTSLPNTSVTWIQSAFGVTATVAQQMLDGTLIMNDITGGDGSTTFMMFPGIRYGIGIQNATTGLNFHTTILPNDNDYMIYCPDVPTFSQNITQLQIVNTSLFITEPNNSYVTFNIVYQDTSGLTTDVKWNVTNWDNMTPMYYSDLGNPFTSAVSDNYTVPNIRGQQWKFWYNATRGGPA